MKKADLLLALRQQTVYGTEKSQRIPVLCDWCQDRGTHRDSRITELSYQSFPSFGWRLPSMASPRQPKISLCSRSWVQGEQQMGKLQEGPIGGPKAGDIPAVTLLPRRLCFPQDFREQSQSHLFYLLQLSMTKTGRLGVQPGQGVIYSIT